MSARLYVYYRVPADVLPATVAAVRALQATLAGQFAGLKAELLCRPEAQHGTLTLMETYAGVDDLPALQAALAAAASGLPQPRQAEVFEALA